MGWKGPAGGLYGAAIGCVLLLLSLDLSRRAASGASTRDDPDGYWRNMQRVHRLFIQPLAVALVVVGVVVFIARGVASL